MTIPEERARLVIVGAGGHGAEVASYCTGIDSVELVGFVDEAQPARASPGVRFLGGLAELARLCAQAAPAPLRYITAVGDNASRRGLVAKLEALQCRNLAAWSLTRTAAYIGTAVEILEGTCLAPGSMVTTRARIGRHCIVNVNASVSHDCVVGDFCNLNPASVVCGNVVLGEGCYIGAGAVIKERITIGPWTIVGAGAIVVDDLPANVTAVGVPARPLARQPVGQR